MAKKPKAAAPSDEVFSAETALAHIRKIFGEESLTRLSATPEKIAVIPSGALSLDRALGIGGYPRGRIVEIYGPESAGKTTLTLHAIAEAQRQGGVAAFIDAEHAFDPAYAAAIGVQLDNLLISQPDCGEQALDIADALLPCCNLIVIDSVAALVPRAELEGGMGDSHMGLHARLMSQALRKMTAKAASTGCCVIFINQLRMKIGVVFGSPEVTTGGQALRFYASVRVDVRRREKIKEGEDAIGNLTHVKVVKNKCAPPFREAEFDIIYGQGIDWAADLLAAAVEAGAIVKSGAWFSLAGGERIGQGANTAAALIRSKPELAAALRAAL